jgi:hypothetical protein
MALRKAERLTKGIVWSKEQESRDDWPRAWKWLGPEFGDCDPKTIIPEHFLRIDHASGEASGLVARIERAVSVTERHRVIKVWRALWAKMQAMGGYCGDPTDPALSFTNSAPQPRQMIWKRREVLRFGPGRLAPSILWPRRLHGGRVGFDAVADRRPAADGGPRFQRRIRHAVLSRSRQDRACRRRDVDAMVAGHPDGLSRQVRC